MFNGWDSVLGVQISFFSLRTRWVELMPKSSILVSSDHNTSSKSSSESSRCLFANFRRARTCAFLSRRTLRALHDFSVTNGHLGDCGPSCLKIINKLLPRSSGLFSHLFHHQVYSTLGDLAWSSRTREIDSQLVFLPFFYYSNGCLVLT